MKGRTRNGSRVLIQVRGAGILICLHGDCEVLLVLQDLRLNTFESLGCFYAYGGYE